MHFFSFAGIQWGSFRACVTSLQAECRDAYENPLSSRKPVTKELCKILKQDQYLHNVFI